jgi:hypothetical protein
MTPFRNEFDESIPHLYYFAIGIIYNLNGFQAIW